MVARLVRNEKVRGSNPLCSTQLLLSELQPTLAGPSERAASVVSEPALVGDACEGFVEFGADLVWAEEDPGEDGPVELLSYCRGCVRVGGVCVL